MQTEPQYLVERFGRALSYRSLEGRSLSVAIPTLALSICATVCVVLRVVTKWWILKTGIQTDDGFLVLCALLNILFVYITISMVYSGFGKHVWLLPEGAVQVVTHKLWWSILNYVTMLGLIKISILISYLQLFPYQRFRYATWAVLVFVSCTTVTMIFLSTFQCFPVAYFWDRTIKGRCLSYHGVIYTTSSLVIVSDLMIVLLPIPVIKNLTLSLAKKLGIILMFAMASFGCVAAIIRLHVLTFYGNTTDPTYDYVGVHIWSVIEVQIPIITICFPSIRLLYKHFKSVKSRGAELNSLCPVEETK